MISKDDLVCEMLIDENYAQEDLHILFKHIKQNWSKFGEEDPHWSVLTDDNYKTDKIKDNVEAFYASGEDDANALLYFLDKSGIDVSNYKSCLEYGCGVGRITGWLAEKFDRVYGCDISKAHLGYAQKYLAGRGVSNVDILHMSEVEDVLKLPLVDVVYSIIVLQHNPPPVIALTIRGFLKALNRGGVAVFQVPTYRKGYSFNLKRYLKDELGKQNMEMHPVLQKTVFEIAQGEGCRIVDVLEDNKTGDSDIFISNTFIIQKT